MKNILVVLIHIIFLMSINVQELENSVYKDFGILIN